MCIILCSHGCTFGLETSSVRKMREECSKYEKTKVVNREQDTEKERGSASWWVSLSHALSVGQSYYRYKNLTRAQIIFISFFILLFFCFQFHFSFSFNTWNDIEFLKNVLWWKDNSVKNSDSVFIYSPWCMTDFVCGTHFFFFLTIQWNTVVTKMF